MKFKEIIKTKAVETFKKTALSAVIYAEEKLGSGFGKTKKEIAIDFLISKLPVWLKPFSPIFREMLLEIAGTLIEKAVIKLQQVQKSGILNLEA